MINPANEEAFARISMGSKADVDKAVAAARKAFDTFSQTTREERMALLEKIIAVYQKRYADIVQAISTEMGAPLSLSQNAQAAIGIGHLSQALKILKEYRVRDGEGLLRHPPRAHRRRRHDHAVELADQPDRLQGCARARRRLHDGPEAKRNRADDALLWAEVMDEAGVPPGVFNLINGDGPTVGEAMSAHPGIDMMSFTGSTRAGVAVAKASADTVKRVAQELGASRRTSCSTMRTCRRRSRAA